jgi:hypothetical protein
VGVLAKSTKIQFEVLVDEDEDAVQVDLHTLRQCVLGVFLEPCTTEWPGAVEE